MAVETKSHLFSHSLDVKKDGYLAGYLAVKQMIATMRRGIGGQGQDSSLCLMFLRTFFYCDMGLVATILFTGEPDVFAERLFDYLRLRFRQFDELARTESRLTPTLERIEEEYLHEGEGVRSHTTWVASAAGVNDILSDLDSVVSPIETPGASWRRASHFCVR